MLAIDIGVITLAARSRGAAAHESVLASWRVCGRMVYPQPAPQNGSGSVQGEGPSSALSSNHAPVFRNLQGRWRLPPQGQVWTHYLRQAFKSRSSQDHLRHPLRVSDDRWEQV